ncbi:uncharacterized protein LOC124434814 isoform X3 [Xenia sp. Carnegie-2017]|uniref:uncharacterized protein LOC124434814 isoform X3 n=1 Tax=Xenia sp. Carnegie-2017 TaxID=2897299 RepID=UPI001F04E318|nr:uncharacterized protein LOC124434814 isoform X3 [Xenia sp. Carnegie-2017]
MKPYSVKYLSPISQNEFISLLTEDVRNRIVKDIVSSEIYSVMADTSPDTSNAVRLVVAVRYVDENNVPNERILEMKETRNKTGEGQAKEILDSLKSRLPICHNGLVYQSYDYTASMSGTFNGVQQHLQEMVGRNIPYIPCQGHRSCKRDSMLQEHMEKIENALKLRNLSKTRWVYRSESIEAVWRSFEAIRNALAEIAKIDNNSLTRTKATSLCKKMVKFEFVFAVMFMRFIMRKTKILTVQMQKPELNILDGLQLIDETVRSLERIRHNESELNDQIDASVEFAKTLGSNPEEEFARKSNKRSSRRLDDNPETLAIMSLKTNYRKCMIGVLDSLIREYRDNIKSCLQKINP